MLRITAIVAMMTLHVSGSKWRASWDQPDTWLVLTVYNTCVRWAVTVFTMISGALFLGRDIPIKRIWQKNILRIVTAFCFWSAIYAFLVYYRRHDAHAALKSFFTGYFHMWFFFMIAAMYMIVPFLRKIAENEQLLKYFIGLAFVFTFLLPHCIKFISFGSSGKAELLNTMMDKMNFHFLLGFTIYFMLGYYLHKTELSSKTVILIYILGIIGFASTIWLTVHYSGVFGKPYDYFIGNIRVNVLFESIFVFTLFKQLFKVRRSKRAADAGAISVRSAKSQGAVSGGAAESQGAVSNVEVADMSVAGAGVVGAEKPQDVSESRAARVITTLSNYSFGAYLVHALFIDLFNLAGFNTLSFNPILSVPVITLIVLIISYIISALIHKIPVLNKYIV